MTRETTPRKRARPPRASPRSIDAERRKAPAVRAEDLATRGAEVTRELELRLRETVETVRRVFGDHDPHYASALENLASALTRLGRVEESHSVEARALEIRNALLIQKRRRRWRDPDAFGSTREERRRDTTPARVTPAVLDIPSAARYLAISPDTLYGLVRSGEVPHARVGKSIRFRVWDLDRFLEERTSRRWERIDRRGRPSRR